MPKILFTGRILPHANITLPNYPVGEWNDPAIGLDITFRTAIENGVVNIKCEMNAFSNEEHSQTVAKLACDLARATIDLIAFKNGAGLLFYLETMTDEPGRVWSLVNQNHELAAIASSLQGNAAFDAIHEIVLGDAKIYLVLRDLVKALIFFNRAPLAASNAVDGIRSHFVPLGETNESGWAPMRENLRLSEEYLKSITDVARGPRHGDYSHIPAI
jgi:hypothetical protein